MLSKFALLEEKTGGHIYAQSVKEVFEISTGQATFFLELAVRAGHAEKLYEVRCPTCKRIMASYKYRHQIPEELVCDAEDGHQVFHLADDRGLIQKVYVAHGSK